MRKKILCFLAAIVLVFSAAKAEVVGGINYDFTTGGAYVRYNPDKYAGNITIPETVSFEGQNYTVVGIDRSAFQECVDLLSVDMPNSIKSLDYDVFRGCKKLASVKLSINIKVISHGAFLNCSSLTTIDLPYGVTHIESNAFGGCSSLNKINFPNSLILINEGAFRGCNSLTSITLPVGIETIGYSAFEDCNNIQEVIFNCKKVGHWFPKCPSLKSVYLGSSVEIIQAGAFSGYTNLANISFSDSNSVVSIGESAFYGCSNISSISLPNSIKSIESYTFEGCTKLSEIEIPESVTSIGFQAFKDCISLSYINLPSGIQTIGSGSFAGCTGLKEFTLTKNIVSIGGGAFYNCANIERVFINCNKVEACFNGLSSIKEVVLGDNVSIIGENAFKGCTGLTTIEIPKGVSVIGYDAFEDCQNLKSIELNCKKIGQWFDYELPAITEIILTENVDSIANLAFYSITPQTIKVLGEKSPCIEHNTFKESVLNESTLITTKGNVYTFINDKEWGRFVKTYVEDNGTLLVPVCNVYGAEGLHFNNASYSDTKVALYPEGTSSVSVVSTKKGRYVFDGEIIYHTPGQSITYTISDYHKLNRFYFCPDDNVLNVTISPAGSLLDKIGIDNVKNIKWLKLSGEMNGTDVMVLRRMDNLEHLDLEDVRIVEGGMAYYDKTTTANDRITGHFLDGLTKLKSIVIPGNVSVIDKDAFRNMASCECIVLGEFLYPMCGLSSIGEYAFAGCSGLNVVRTPFGLQSIGWKAFDDCTNVQRLVVRSNSKSLDLGYWKQPVKELYLERDVANCTFNGNKNLSKVILAGNITKITEQMFAYCPALNQMRMSDKVNTIENQAFQSCTGLTALALNKKLASIGASAFSGCNNLTVIVSANPTPPDIQSSTFDEMTEKSATLYVPVGSKTAYWLHQYWGNFYNIVETDDFETPMGVESITVVPQQKSNRVYNLSGQLVKVLNEQITLDQVLPAGIYIVGGKKIIVK